MNPRQPASPLGSTALSLQFAPLSYLFTVCLEKMPQMARDYVILFSPFLGLVADSKAQPIFDERINQYDVTASLDLSPVSRVKAEFRLIPMVTKEISGNSQLICIFFVL